MGLLFVLVHKFFDLVETGEAGSLGAKHFWQYAKHWVVLKSMFWKALAMDQDGQFDAWEKACGIDPKGLGSFQQRIPGMGSHMETFLTGAG